MNGVYFLWLARPKQEKKRKKKTKEPKQDFSAKSKWNEVEDDKNEDGLG